MSREDDLLKELTAAMAAIEEAAEQWQRTGEWPPDLVERIRRWEGASVAADPVVRETLARLPADFAVAVERGDFDVAEMAADVVARLADLRRRLEEDGGEDQETTND
jgi:hypothetical protein